MSEGTTQADVETLNREVREIWDSKAAFWDAQLGEGNLFQRVVSVSKLRRCPPSSGRGRVWVSG